MSLSRLFYLQLQWIMMHILKARQTTRKRNEILLLHKILVMAISESERTASSVASCNTKVSSDTGREVWTERPNSIVISWWASHDPRSFRHLTEPLLASLKCCLKICKFIILQCYSGVLLKTNKEKEVHIPFHHMLVKYSL